ncbi:MAG TPA: hypothetical protein PK961_17505 [bacterium]|nr:hypothetical protein [bacterium]
MSRFYNFYEFVDSLMDLDRLEIINKAEWEGKNADRLSYNVKGAVQRREDGIVEYSRKIGGLIFFLRNEIKPASMEEDDFQALRPLCEKLVEKKQLSKDVLDMFEE